MMDYSRKVAVFVVIDLDEDVFSSLCAICLCKVKRSRREDVREIVVHFESIFFPLEFKVASKYVRRTRTISYDHRVEYSNRIQN